MRWNLIFSAVPSFWFIVFIILKMICICVLPVCMSMYHVYLLLEEARHGQWIPDCCELPCRCWELNESPLGVANALNSERFLQPRFLVLTFKNNFLSFISTKVTQEGKKCLGLFYCLFSKRVDNSLGIFWLLKDQFSDLFNEIFLKSWGWFLEVKIQVFYKTKATVVLLFYIACIYLCEFVRFL